MVVRATLTDFFGAEIGIMDLCFDLGSTEVARDFLQLQRNLVL